MADSLVSAPAVEQLAPSFKGQLLREGDEGYEAARRVWNGCFDRRPALIAQCGNVADVQAAVRFARENGLEVAVRGGGHSAQGFGTWDDALVIDLSPMKAIEVDPEARTARAEAGMTWGEFDAATQEHGLAVTGGRFSTTGIAGLTLGSGSGWIERRCGLTGDNLISAEVVTADGSVVTASADQNADLFWGLRGGSGNFGVVTSFTYRLHQIGPMIYGGLLVSMPDRGPDVLRYLREFMPTAPDDFGCAAAFLSAPPEPFVPEEMHFAPVFGVVICWTGDHEEGERVLAPLREVAQPVMDMVAPMPYTALQSMLDASGPHGIRGYIKAEFLEEMSDDAIEKLARYGASRPGPMIQLLLEPLGGAIGRVDEGASALGRRDVPWVFHALSMWMDPGQEAADAHIAWAKDLAGEMSPHTVPGVYLNFTSDEGDDRVRSTYGEERYSKLVALKDRYDPENLFHLNQNIKPSGAR
jgi:FAD binding domain/Berberine and berberine like